MSDNFEIRNGMRQGAILSPLLFSIYLNPLLNKINKCNTGCDLGDNASKIFAYADDLVVLSPTLGGLKEIINHIASYSDNYQINFNAEKSFILPYSYHLSEFDINVELNGSQIKMVNHVEHLGFFMSSGRYSYEFDNIIKDMNVKTNVLRSNFSCMSLGCKVKLFKAHCLHLYGCELWDLSDRNLTRLEITWKKCIKSLLNLDIRTRSKLLPSIIDGKNVILEIYGRQLNFFIKGLNHYDENINFYFKHSLLSNCSYTVTNLNKILSHCEIPFLSIFDNKRIIIKKPKIEDEWKMNLIKELCYSYIRDFKLFEILYRSQIYILLKFLCTE